MKYPNFWHQPIPCDCYQQINYELGQWAQARTEDLVKRGLGFEHLEFDTLYSMVPSLRPWLDSLNIGPIKNVALVVIGANKHQSIHIDAQLRDLALNFGIQVKNTHTNMFRIIEGQATTIPYGKQGLVYHSYNDCILEKETEFTLEDNPVLFNTKHVHQVVNPTDVPRVAVSLRFFEDPSHLISQS
jgi:hypothetical protein